MPGNVFSVSSDHFFSKQKIYQEHYQSAKRSELKLFVQLSADDEIRRPTRFVQHRHAFSTDSSSLGCVFLQNVSIDLI